jgi:hypothetical protein
LSAFPLERFFGGEKWQLGCIKSRVPFVGFAGKFYVIDAVISFSG